MYGFGDPDKASVPIPILEYLLKGVKQEQAKQNLECMRTR